MASPSPTPRSSSRCYVIHHRRMEDGWFRRDLSEGEVVLDGLPDGVTLRLTLADIYDRLDAIG